MTIGEGGPTRTRRPGPPQREAPRADDPVEARTGSLGRLLGEIVRRMPGVDHAGFTVRAGEAVLVQPRSAAWLAELDRCQQAGEGPCAAALRESRTSTVVVDDLGAELERWPEFARIALAHGVASMLAFVLAPPGAPPGVVTLYSARPGLFVGPARNVGKGFAVQVAVSYYGSELVGSLVGSLEDRELVGRASGILMERFGLDEQQAATMLAGISQDSGSSLEQTAGWLVAEGKPPRPG